MPRQPRRTSEASAIVCTANFRPREVTRDDWCPVHRRVDQAQATHASHRLAKTLAPHQYDSKEHPRDEARQYDKGTAERVSTNEEAREVTRSAIHLNSDRGHAEDKACRSDFVVGEQTEDT